MQSLAAGGHRISGAVDVVEKVGEEEEEEARHVVAVAVVVNEIEVVQLGGVALLAEGSGRSGGSSSYARRRYGTCMNK